MVAPLKLMQILDFYQQNWCWWNARSSSYELPSKEEFRLKWALFQLSWEPHRTGNFRNQKDKFNNQRNVSEWIITLIFLTQQCCNTDCFFFFYYCLNQRWERYWTPCYSFSPSLAWTRTHSPCTMQNCWKKSSHCWIRRIKWCNKIAYIIFNYRLLLQTRLKRLIRLIVMNWLLK